MLLSVLPMAAGVAMGKGLQGSLYWGLSVINGGKDDETEATDSLVENTELSTISESEGTENRDGGSTVSASQVEALKKAAEEKLAEQAKEQQKPLKERLKRKICSSSKQHSRKCDECKTIYCGNYPGKYCAFGCAWKFDGAFTGD